MLRKFSLPLLCRAVTTASALLALTACGPASPPPAQSSASAGDASREGALIADAALGRALIEQYQCGRCHTIPGVAAARGSVAVTLEGFGARSYIAGRFANRPDALVAWLIDPPALVPGTLMPNLGVDAAQARHMAAYLGSLQ